MHSTGPGFLQEDVVGAVGHLRCACVWPQDRVGATKEGRFGCPGSLSALLKTVGGESFCLVLVCFVLSCVFSDSKLRPIKKYVSIKNSKTLKNKNKLFERAETGNVTTSTRAKRACFIVRGTENASTGFTNTRPFEMTTDDARCQVSSNSRESSVISKFSMIRVRRFG